MRFVNAGLAGLAACVLAAILAHGRNSPFDNYVLLAQAFAHGQTAIRWPGAWIDALPFGGQYYIIEGPLPAALLVPWVAMFGTANQTVLAVLLCGVAVGACWLTCEQLAVSRTTNVWICAFLFAGTQLAWCAMLGDVWFIAHVAAAACSFLALAELTGKRRGSLVALALVAAAFARFSLVLAIPVFAWLVVRERSGPERRRAALGFAAVVALGIGVWAAYNYARWGVWYDIGYTRWYNQDSAGAPDGSPFQLRYFPYQLWSFFWQGPQFTAVWPFVIPTYNGLALTWTSPALVIALVRAPSARARHRVVARHPARRRTVVHLLRERLRAVRHASRARLRAVSRRVDGVGDSRPRAAARESGDRVVGRGRLLGHLVLECLLPALTSPGGSSPTRCA